MRLSRTFDAAALAGVCLCLLVAFYYQLALGELPCAFCNLERVGFMIFGAGLLLNLRWGASPWNHVLSALGALIGSLVALAQMFVHVLPKTPPTGTAFLGLHMYTWTYIVLTGAIGYSVLSLAAMAAGPAGGREERAPSRLPGAPALCILFTVLVGANLVSAFLENGFHPFKGGGQLHYLMLHHGDVMKP